MAAFGTLISLPSNMSSPFSPPMIKTLSESECHTSDQVDELASDSEKYQQSENERSASLQNLQAEHIEQVVESTISDLDAVVRSAADKTHLPAEYFMWKWNAEMAARLCEQKNGGSPGFADSAKSPESYKTVVTRRGSRRVNESPVALKTPRRQGGRDSKLETELRTFLVKYANEMKIPALCDGKGFKWTKLLELLADNGHYLDNYPNIPIPGASGMKAGIREFSANEMRVLLDAMQSTNHRCEFKVYRSQSLGGTMELLDSEAPILIRAPSKDGSRRSERFYLNGTSDFEGHAMCREHQECREETSAVGLQLLQEELGTHKGDRKHERGNVTDVKKRRKTKLA